MQNQGIQSQPGSMAFGAGTRSSGGARRSKPRGGIVFWAAVALAVVGWSLLTPVLTVRDMRAAARNGDAERLNRHVDYEALRESLKTQFSAYAQADSMLGDEDAAYRAFGAAVATAAVDYMVTPEMVATFLTGSPPDPSTDRLFGQASQSASARAIMERYRDTAADRQRQERAEQIEKNLHISMGYEGLNQFAVTVRNRGDDGAPPVVLVLRRYGLGWKLAGVRMGKG